MDKEQLYRKRATRKRWLQELEGFKIELAEKLEEVAEKKAAGAVFTGPTEGSVEYVENRISTLEAQLAEINKLDLRTKEEKRGLTRKTYTRTKEPDLRGLGSEKEQRRRLRRLGLLKGDPEIDLDRDPLWQSLDYSSEIRRLGGAIRQAQQDRDFETARALKKERKALPGRFPLIWREWLSRPIHQYRTTGEARPAALKLAHEAGEAYLKKYSTPLEKEKNKFWNRRLPDLAFDADRGIDPATHAANAERLLADILAAMNKQRAAQMRRKNITMIERAALARCYASLGVPFDPGIIRYSRSWQDSSTAYLKLVR